jgi:hypothetical protein
MEPSLVGLLQCRRLVPHLLSIAGTIAANEVHAVTIPAREELLLFFFSSWLSRKYPFFTLSFKPSRGYWVSPLEAFASSLSMLRCAQKIESGLFPTLHGLTELGRSTREMARHQSQRGPTAASAMTEKGCRPQNSVLAAGKGGSRKGRSMKPT